MKSQRRHLLSLTCILVLAAASALAAVTSGAPAHAQGRSPGLPGITRDAILARAKIWVDQAVPYDTSQDHPDGYKHDCSGFVSWAWGLAAPGLGTQGLIEPGVSTQIFDLKSLQPGDILDNGLSESEGHVALFVSYWKDKSGKIDYSHYNSYEESASNDPKYPQYHDDAVFVQNIPIPYWPGSGTYHAYRFNGIDTGGGQSGAAGDVAGRVIDGQTSQGVPAVKVTFSGSGTTDVTYSDNTGYYHFSGMPQGLGSLDAITTSYLQGSASVVVRSNASVQAPDILLYPICALSSTLGASGGKVALGGHVWMSGCTSPTSTPTDTPPTPPPTSGTATSVSGLQCSTPGLSSPQDGATFSQSDDIALYWNTNCPQSYLELSGGPYGTLNFGGWSAQTGLDVGQMWPGTYSWHVNGMDSNGNQTGYSGTWTFTVNAMPLPSPTPTPTLPPSLSCGTPSLSSPGNGSSYAQNTDITLYWNTNCSQSYVELSGGPYGTLNFGGWQSAASVHIGQMWPGTYSWHVNGMDSNGNQTGYSGTWTFTVNSAPAPTPTPVPSVPAPNLSSPGNGYSYAQNTDITLYWNTGYPQGYCELWGAPYSTLNFGGWQNATSIHIGQMWPGTFSWHCMVRDSNGNQSPWSSTWTFTINQAPAPTPTPVPSYAVTLSSPGNGSSYPQSTSITLYWNTNYPQSYCELWGAPYSTLNFGGWTTAHSITIGQMWPGTFSWHCQARDNNGNVTGWSPTWTFTIQ